MRNNITVVVKNHADRVALFGCIASSTQITAMQQHWSLLYLGEEKDHKTPNDLQAAREEESPSPGTEGISVLGNSISQVRHNNLGDSSTCNILISAAEGHWQLQNWRKCMTQQQQMSQHYTQKPTAIEQDERWMTPKCQTMQQTR